MRPAVTAFFPLAHGSEAHLHCSLCQCFLPFYGRVIVHRIYRSHFVYRLSVDEHWAIFTFWLLWLALLWMCVYKAVSSCFHFRVCTLEWSCWVLWLGLQGDPTSPSQRKSVVSIHWKVWCWSWNSNTLATWCEELTHWKRPWCWERLKAGGERDDRGWDGWMASPTQRTWVWVNSRSWWWTGRPDVLQSMGLQRVGCNWATGLTEAILWTYWFKNFCECCIHFMFHWRSETSFC